MDQLLVNVLNGIAFGMILFLLSMGLSLTLGVMGILNLTHGAFFMVGGFLGWSTVRLFGNFWLAAIFGSITVGVIGLFIERLFLSRLYSQLDGQVLLTLGLIYIIANITYWIYGGHGRVTVPPSFLASFLTIGNHNFPLYRLALILIGSASFVCLWWLVDKTRIGAIIRAGMDDKEMTIGLGVNYGVICSAIFAMGAFAGGFAGFLGTPVIGVVFSMSLDILLYALIVVVVGGPGSVLGTLIGALLIGIMDSFGKVFFPDFAMFTIYVVLIITLLVKPSGILGRPQEQQKGMILQIAIRSDSESHLAEYTAYIVSFLILVFLPLFLPSYLQSMLTKVLIFAIFAMSLNLIWGYTGLISLGHAAFFGVGGYTTGILILRYGNGSFWTSGLLGILMAGIIAALFGIIALRVAGIYFLLVTLALGQLVYYIAMVWRPMTNGSDGIVGIPFPDLGIPWLRWDEVLFYYFVLLVFVICFFILYRIVKSPFGCALQGIRDQEPRMRCLGYNTWVYKYIAFIIAGTFAGVAGVLFGHFLGMIHPLHASIATSTIALLMVIIGSTRVIFGPIIGAALIVLLEYFSSLYAPARWPLILGAVFIISVMFLRGGIGIYLVRLWDRVSCRYGSAKS